MNNFLLDKNPMTDTGIETMKYLVVLNNFLLDKNPMADTRIEHRNFWSLGNGVIP